MFYLGVPEPAWLKQTSVPLFVSHRRLARRSWPPEPGARPPRALGPWALDSGGFTELTKYGRWVTTPEEYVHAVRTYTDLVGNLQWAAPQDWMVEPEMLERTGLTVEDHQERTVANYLELIELYGPGHPFVPVLQGWELDEYHRCADSYASAGVVLEELPRVGLGTVCRRQDTDEAARILTSLADRIGHGRLHGFGVKTRGFDQLPVGLLASADSMAWSLNARKNPHLRRPGCVHPACQNCIKYALWWRDNLLDRHPELARRTA